MDNALTPRGEAREGFGKLVPGDHVDFDGTELKSMLEVLEGLGLCVGIPEMAG